MAERSKAAEERATSAMRRAMAKSQVWNKHCAALPPSLQQLMPDTEDEKELSTWAMKVGQEVDACFQAFLAKRRNLPDLPAAGSDGGMTPGKESRDTRSAHQKIEQGLAELGPRAHLKTDAADSRMKL